MYEVFTHWIGLAAEHESSRKPFGTRKAWRGIQPRNTRKGFRVRLRRFSCLFVFSPAGKPKGSVSFSVPRRGFSVFSGKRLSTRREEIYHRTHRNGLSADTESHRRGGMAYGRTRKAWRVFVSGFAGFRVFSCSAPQGNPKASVSFSVPRSGFQCVQWFSNEVMS